MRKLSHSMLDTYSYCGYKCWLKHFEFIKPFQDIRYPLVTGVAFHKLLDQMYKVCNFNKNFLVRNWKNVFMDCLEEEGSAFSTTEGYDKYLQYGYGLISQFHKFAQDNGYLIKPLQSEWPFTIKINEMQITGKVDLIIQRDSSKPVEILDFKTGRTLPSQALVDENKQLTIYDWAVKTKLGFDNREVGLLFPRKGIILRSVRSENDHNTILTELTNLYDNIKANKFDPNNLHCPKCEYQKNCKYFKK